MNQVTACDSENENGGLTELVLSGRLVETLNIMIQTLLNLYTYSRYYC